MINFIFGIVILLTSFFCTAQNIFCTPMEPGKYQKVFSMPLSVQSLSVTSDKVLGSVLFEQRFKMQTTNFSMNFNCTNDGESFTPTNITSYEVSGGSLSAWQPNDIYSGKVYKTSNPGVGVVASYGSDRIYPLINNRELWANPCGKTTCTTYLGQTDRQILVLRFIKTGNITATPITGNTLPIYKVTEKGEPPLSYANGFFSFSLALSGTVQINIPTCDVMNNNVYLDSHSINEENTDWVDFDIDLINCGAFNGSVANLPEWTGDGGFIVPALKNKNFINFSLIPSYGTATNYPDVMMIDTSRPESATGFGVQIARKDGGAIKFMTQMDSGITTESIDGYSYVIKMKARYVKIDSSVKPGVADSAMVVMLNYR